MADRESRTQVRVAVVIPVHWVHFMGGAQYQGKLIVEQLCALSGVEVHFMARVTAHDEEADRLGYKVHQFGRNKRLAGTNLLGSLRLWRLLNRVRPEVVYQRVGCAYTGVVALYCRRNSARMVWHVAHELDVSPATRGAWRSPKGLLQAIEKRMLEYGLRHADAIVVQNRHQGELLAQNYGRRDALCVPNMHPVPPLPMQKVTSPRLVLWVANFKPWKRPEAFVRLARTLAHRPDVRFVMIGSGPAKSEEREALARELEGLSGLNWLGRQTQDQVNQLLEQASVFVNTSEHEGFANTFIQAWLRETPVLSLGFNPDGLLDGERFGYCAREDETAMATTLAAWLDQPERLRRMGRAARDMAEADFSVQNFERLRHVMGL